MQDGIKGHIMILIANILFAVALPVFKFLLSSGFPPEAIVIMRVTFACIAFWTVSLFLPKENVDRKDILRLIICALCGVCLNQLFFVIGLVTASPINASIISTAVPIFVMILAALILKEPITKMRARGVFLGVCGGLLLVLTSYHGVNRAGSVRGDLLIAFNNLLYSFYLVLSRPLSQKYSPITLMKWMFLVSVIVLAPICSSHLKDVPLFYKATFNAAQLLGLLYLLLGSTFFAFLLTQFALRYIRPTTASMYNYVQPIVASTIAIAAAQDHFSWVKLFSTALVFIGVYLVTKSKKRSDVIVPEG
jgi:Permeases of the drug/metabolite transporter (DMT) superfamily